MTCERLGLLALGDAEVDDAQPARRPGPRDERREVALGDRSVGDDERALGPGQGRQEVARPAPGRPARSRRRRPSGDRDAHALQRRSSSLDRGGDVLDGPARVDDVGRELPVQRLAVREEPLEVALARGSAGGRRRAGRGRASTSSGTDEEHHLAGRSERDAVGGFEHHAAAARDDRWIARRRRRRAPRPRARGTEPRRPSSKISRTEAPAARSISSSSSTNGTPSRRASSGPTVDLPEPGIPTR